MKYCLNCLALLPSFTGYPCLCGLCRKLRLKEAHDLELLIERKKRLTKSRNKNNVQTYDYRPKALTAYGPICQACGFNEHVRLLEVHHIDENRANNELINLAVLCVMCHAKITRLGVTLDSLKATA